MSGKNYDGKDWGEKSYKKEQLELLAYRLMKTGGLRDEDARTVAQDLVKADMRGLYSHGITRIPMYLKRTEAGCVKARPEIQVEQAGAAVLKVDGDAGGI